MRPLLLALTLLGQSAFAATAQEPDMRIVRGEALVRSLCAECHAIGRADRSPHASAPPFRSR